MKEKVMENRLAMEYEDEIDIVDLIKILKKRSRMIFVIFSITILISLGVGISKYEKDKRVTTIISYNFNDVSDGLNPDGSRFNPNLISSNEVLNMVLKKMAMENKNLNILDIRENLTITPIVPKHIAAKIKSELEEGLYSSYNASNYELSLKTIVDSETTKKILQAMVIEFSDYYKKRYAQSNIIPMLELNKEYEYNDYIEISEYKLKEIESIIESKNNQGYISKQYGIGFSIILNRIDIIREIEFSKIKQYLNVEGLSKDKNTVLRKLNYNIERLKSDRQKKLNEVEALNKILSIYRPQKNKVIISGMRENIVGENKDDYYSKLIERTADAAVIAGNISQEINVLEQNKKQIKMIKNEDNAEIDQAIIGLQKEMKSIITISNNVLEEYNNRFITNYVKTITPVEELKNTKKAMMIIGIGMILGLFLGIFIAFIKEFFENVDLKK